MPAHSFNLVASFYDPLARLVFGTSLYQAQLRHLDLVPPGGRVLLIGGGSGCILPEVFRRTACREVVFLEASANMVAKARRLVWGQAFADKITFRVGTEEDLDPRERYDVVLTYFFLDLFAPPLLYPIANQLYQALQPGGWWLASDFVPARGPWLRRAGAALLFQSMYGFFRLTCGISATTLADWQALLAGFALKPVKSCYFYHGLILSAAYQKTRN